MTSKEPENETEVIIKSHEDQDITSKFKTYRLNSEFSERKLKESKIVIDRLNDEINLSRDVEKNLRKQVSHAHNRLIQLQRSLHQLTVISERQRENAKTAQLIDQKVEELDKLIKSTRVEAQNLFNKTSTELDMIKENEELKTTVKRTTAELDLAKSETQSLREKNFHLEVEYEQRIKAIQEELEKAKLECSEKEMQYNETILIYKTQVLENEEIIKAYERERKSLLEEFEPPKTEKDLENCDVNVAWADSTVSITAEERKKRKENKKETNEMNTNQLFNGSDSQMKSPNEKRSKKESGEKFPRMRQRPQLQFLSQSQSSSQKPTETTTKWRLFSTNYNHYIN